MKNRNGAVSDDGYDSHKKANMLTREIERRDHLVHKVNMASTIMLQSETGGFENDLLRSMCILGRSVDSDRVCIWKNQMRDGELYCTRLFEWSLGGRSRQGAGFTEDVPYGEKLHGWETILSQGGCINEPVREMSASEREYFATQGTVSTFVAPIFVQNEFWGFIAYDYCRAERVFSTDEQSILRSTGILLTAAWLRNEMMLNIRAGADKLEAALKEAREANDAKSKFLAKMSHEMRTPLNTIIGLSELTMEDPGVGGETRANLEKINHAGSILLGTVNDILDISKIEVGKFELLPVEYDVSSLINDTVTQNTMHIMGKPISFVLDIDGGLPRRLYGDDLRIKHILNNLLSNAFKYTREGTVTLSISCERSGNDVWMTATVRDTGMGIRREDLADLFSEYTKLDAKSNRKIEGTGLGLSITKGVVEMMDGSVLVESEYGKGSVFTARFKQRFVTSATIGEGTADNLKGLNYTEHKHREILPIKRVSLPNARVLVVDDVTANLDVALSMMKPYGMRVDCLTNGREAVEAVRRGDVRYDAIFMDHMMPEMDGIEAARLIREIESEYAKTVPIIAFTANAVVGSKEMFLDNGFQAFFSKPIDVARLDAVIREWVKEPPGGGMFSAAKIAGLDADRGLERFAGDEGSYVRVLHSYVAGMGPLLEEVKAVNRENLAAYAVAVHGVKGSSANIGAGELAEKAKALEEAAGKGDFDFVAAGNDDFVNDAEKLVGELNVFLRTGERERGKVKRHSPDDEALDRLAAACERGDIDAVDDAMREIEACEYEAGGDLVAWLRENVDGMDYAEIAKKLRDGR